MQRTANPPALQIREVSPRDGLQAEAPQSTADRINLIHRLVDCGVRNIEVASFVRDDLVPSMANAEAVVERLPQVAGLVCFGLVANQKGVARAAACGLRQITVTVSLSDTYSRKNVGESALDAVRTVESMLKSAQHLGLYSDVVVSCSFGSPFGDVDALHDLPDLLHKLGTAGPDAITLADTTGVATPRLISRVAEMCGTDFGIHLHDSIGNALVNAYAAMQSGFTQFDTSLGGIGGSPFAPGAMGNLATESLVLLAHNEGRATGIDLDSLLEVGRYLQTILKHELPSRLLQVSSN